MAKTTKAAPAKTSKKPAKPDPLDEPADDLLATKPKKAAAKTPAAKKAAAPVKKKAAKETTGGTEDVKAVLLKTKKLTSYADVASENNFDIRMVRRTARALRDEGLLTLQKEGTVIMLRKA